MKATYSRLWDGKILTANIKSFDENKVVYTLNGSKTIHRENTQLFLSVFS